MGTGGQKLSSKSKAKIFIVEDHSIACHGLVTLLNQQPELQVCGTAVSVRDAMRGITKSKPDLVIADISLREGNGLEMVATMTTANPALAVLVLSMHEENLNAELALSMGARGYLMKHCALDHILTAVRKVLRGEIYLSDVMTSRLLEKRGARSARSSHSVELLSHREREVFQLIGQWVGTKDIAGQLRVSVKTIEYYRRRIKQKLHLQTATDLVHFATEWLRQEGNSEKPQPQRARSQR